MKIQKKKKCLRKKTTYIFTETNPSSSFRQEQTTEFRILSSILLSPLLHNGCFFPVRITDRYVSVSFTFFISCQLSLSVINIKILCPLVCACVISQTSALSFIFITFFVFISCKSHVCVYYYILYT